MTVKLQVGLTELTDSLVNGNITYQVTDDKEQAQLEWNLNIDFPAVNTVVDLLKTIFTLPHVNSIGYSTNNERETMFTLDVIGLFPYDNEPVAYTDDDYAKFVSPRKTYGGLYLNPVAAYADNGADFNQSSEYAVTNNTLKSYSGDAAPIVATSFIFNFLDSAIALDEFRYDTNVQDFIKNHKDEMIAQDIDIRLFLKTYGRMLVGTLVNDPTEARDIIQKYPRVCRIEIIE